jgi:endonuclease/exonuclease/phosphatase family metal-dependent hydrolase
MHYQNLDPDIASGLKELQTRIDKQKIPESSLDKTLLIATWNIREFGNPARPRLKKSLYYIAEILSWFDLIGVVELRDNVHEIAEVLQLMGPTWDIIYSDFIEDHGGNHERVGYIYDKRACLFTGLAGNATEPRKKKGTEYRLKEGSWWRKPFMASFRAGSFDFIALTTHIRWGKAAKNRATELGMLADYVYARTVADTAIDRDVIVMGDFNIPSLRSSLYKTVVERGLRMPASLAGITGSNLARNKRYDQILHNPVYTKSFTKKGGVLDFIGKGWGALYPEAKSPFDQDYTYQLSDHLPLWVMIQTDTDDEQLDQILAPRSAKRARHDRGG